MLYLMDNSLAGVRTLGYLPSLRGLYLQSNELTSTEGLDQLPYLTELNLDDNKISTFEGLASSTCLCRLSLTAQRTATPLFFCPKVLTVLSQSLRYLNISKNRVQDLAPIGKLQFLEALHATENLVREIGSIEAMLDGCRKLSTVDLRHNPVTKVRHYWDRLLLGASTTLKEADGREVTCARRSFVRELHKRRCAFRGQRAREGEEKRVAHSNSESCSGNILVTRSLQSSLRN
ncbi:putative leucine rich repeat protein [Neospora caninum Liverpool]|uniref:Leucine rich repeat protein, putative n=1 Tax=Neospora caninum (strain Liverpool) TaxID=572307 RepID=F0VP21_NEOCL|nr:putative leucine rich repeat protein [Neospora caninum Liverpool]CBZ55467.1 putative leucine rich repeat protein [Neospora caninum Liverpool]CEL70204.1 TPA: leucine rich repeat protein, putative [Neospora caninum Liverpool]|eukprot:XP_003885495.1 putative leucine rich repeat protein [Neospora caninum Liverpool]